MLACVLQVCRHRSHACPSRPAVPSLQARCMIHTGVQEGTLVCPPLTPGLHADFTGSAQGFTQLSKPHPSAQAPGRDDKERKKVPVVTLTLVSFAVTRKAYQKITERFAAEYEARTGQAIKFRLSFGGSGTQVLIPTIGVTWGGLCSNQLAWAVHSGTGVCHRQGLHALLGGCCCSHRVKRTLLVMPSQGQRWSGRRRRLSSTCPGAFQLNAKH